MKLTLRKWGTFLVSFTASVSSFAQYTSNDGTLSLNLDKAIEIALAKNPTIRVADQEVQLKEVANKEAWQTLLPSVTVDASLQHTLLAAQMKLGGNTFKMGQDNTNTAAASATLSLPLFAPAVYQNMKLTKEDILLAQEKARGSRLDLINQVTKAYYAALLSKDSYDVVKKGYNTAKENFDVVSSKYDVGSVSEYDKISAEVQMRSMNSSLVSTETGLRLALLQLKVLMGVTADMNLSIEDSLKRYENSLVLANNGNEDLGGNTTLRQLDANTQLLMRARKTLYTNFMPTLAFQLTGQYQSLYNDNWNLFKYSWAPSASFAFALSIPIFKASNFTSLKSNSIQLKQMEDTRLDTERKLQLAAEGYKQNMASTIAQVESNKKAVEQANKAVTISSKRYDVGRGTILELNQSETALTQAELTYAQSIYDYLTNSADLDYTLGRETYLK